MRVSAMKRSNNPKKFFSSTEVSAIEHAIKDAESLTSAEIKLFVNRHCWRTIKGKAAGVFKKLGLHKTENRNCVLILLVLSNREFLIYGDQGIHEKVGQDFWDDTRATMATYFKKDLFGEGVCAGIKLIGEQLAKYFPAKSKDKNEISDTIKYEK
jgi:uncharacterized membrane protein